MKKILPLLFLCLMPLLAQTNVQKDANKKLSNGSIIVGDGTSITATGTGIIAATSLPGFSINTTAPLTGGGALTGNLTLAIPAATNSVSGYLTSADHTSFAAKQPAGNYITALTGDVSATGPGSVAATLATVNTNVGTFGSSSAIPIITVNGKGLITAVSTAAFSSLPSQTGNSGKFLTTNGSAASWSSAFTGSFTGNVTGSNWNFVTAQTTPLTTVYVSETTLLNQTNGTGGTGAARGPFGIVVGESSFSGGGQTFNDAAVYFGYNVDGGGGNLVNAEPRFSFQIEQDYWDGTRHNLESYFEWRDKSTISPRRQGRPIFWQFNRDTGDMTLFQIAMQAGINFTDFAGDKDGNGDNYVFGNLSQTALQFNGTPTQTSATQLNLYAQNGKKSQIQFNATGAAEIIGTATGLSLIASGSPSQPVNIKPTSNVGVPANGLIVTDGLSTFNGAVTMAGALSGVTSLTMNGALSGATTGTFSSSTGSGGPTQGAVVITGGLGVGGNIYAGGLVAAASGSAANPGLTFSSQSDQGFYSINSVNLGLSIGGVLRFTFGNGGLIAGSGGSNLTLNSSGDYIANAALGRTAQVQINGSTIGSWSATGLTITGDVAPTGNYSTKLKPNRTASLAAWGLSGPVMQTAATLTDTSSSGTIASAVAITFGQPTFGFNSATTVTDAANVYIEAGVNNGGNGSFSRSWSLWSAGRVYFAATGDVNGGTIGDGSVYSAGGIIAAKGIYANTTLNAGTTLTVGTTASVGSTLTVTGASTLTGGVLTGNGTASAPSHSFTSATNTGLYYPGSNGLGIATNGTSALTISNAQVVSFTGNVGSGGTAQGTIVVTGGVGVSGNINAGGYIAAGSGTAGAPGITFSAQQDQGFYVINSTVMGLSIGGVKKFDFTNNSYIDGASGGGQLQLGAAPRLQNNTGFGISISNTVQSSTVVSIDSTYASTSTSTGALQVSGGAGIGGNVYIGGDFATATAGKTLLVKSGTNAAAGTVTLVAGTATITSTAIDANTVIILSEKTAGGTPGLYAPLAAVSAGSAVITSAATDTSTYNWVALKVN